MLPWPQRLYFWGVHGIFSEVIFTGIWEFVVSGKWSLMGFSSIWSFLVYGIGGFTTEWVRDLLISYKISLLMRCLVYVFCAYVWEFSWGLLLDTIDARPWDYTDFDYDVMGLITLEYAPAWFLGGLWFEAIMAAMETVQPIPRWSPQANVKDE